MGVCGSSWCRWKGALVARRVVGGARKSDAPEGQVENAGESHPGPSMPNSRCIPLRRCGRSTGERFSSPRRAEPTFLDLRGGETPLSNFIPPPPRSLLPPGCGSVTRGVRRNRMTLFLNPATCTIQFSVYFFGKRAAKFRYLSRSYIRDALCRLSRRKISRQGISRGRRRQRRFILKFAIFFFFLFLEEWSLEVNDSEKVRVKSNKCRDGVN